MPLCGELCDHTLRSRDTQCNAKTTSKHAMPTATSTRGQKKCTATTHQTNSSNKKRKEGMNNKNENYKITIGNITREASRTPRPKKKKKNTYYSQQHQQTNRRRQPTNISGAATAQAVSWVSIDPTLRRSGKFGARGHHHRTPNEPAAKIRPLNEPAAKISIRKCGFSYVWLELSAEKKTIRLHY